MSPKIVCLFLISLPMIHYCTALTGWAFSGGGSRIGEEAAMMEALLMGLTPSGKQIRPDVVTGASAGSISCIALNAILKTLDGNSTVPYTFDDYKYLLFNMTDSAIFDTSISGIYKIFSTNIPAGFILDNSPLRNLLGQQLKKMGFENMGDLYIPTCVSVVEANTGLTQRICSDDPAVQNVPVIDVIMASGSLPVAFPMAKIRNFNPPIVNGSGLYIDGGTGSDMIPIFPLLNRWKVDTAFIIARQNEIGTRGDLPPWIQNIAILANTIAMAEDMFQSLFQMALEEARNAKTPCFSYIPVLDRAFSTFDFAAIKEMFELTMTWAKQNDPIRLNPSSSCKRIRVN